MKSYRRVIAVSLLLVCFSAVSGVAYAFDAARIGEAYFQALETGEQLPIVDLPPEEKTAANAYAAQAFLVGKLLDRNKDYVAGYKAGVTAPAQMQRFGTDRPASAPLFKSGLSTVADPKTPVVLKPFKGMMLETEFAFKTVKPITEPVKDEKELKCFIESVHPAIEIPQVYFADMARVGFFDLTAAAIGSKAFLIGLPQPVDADFDNMQVTLFRDGAPVNEGKGADALGGQWKALLWLINDTLAQGNRIEAGQYLLTGALGKMIPAPAGKYKAEYPFGTLLFDVSAE